MDPSGMQKRLSGGKRRMDVYGGDDDVVHEISKMPRMWMSPSSSGQGAGGDEGDSGDHLSQVNQAIDYRGMNVDHWVRLQQQQQQPPQHQQHKLEPAAPTTPLNMQQPLNLQQQQPPQRGLPMTSGTHEIRGVDPSNQSLLPGAASHQLRNPQHSAHLQQQQHYHQQHHHQHQHQPPHQQHQQHVPSTSASQGHKFQQLNSTDQLNQHQHYNHSHNHNHNHNHNYSHIQMPPYPDLSSSSRPPSSSSALPPLPLSFRPPPIFAEADLRHSPTSSSSNQYPLANVMPQPHPQSHSQPQPQQQSQKFPPQVSSSSQFLGDSDEDRYSGILSNQSSVLQQQQASTGLSGTSNSLVLQELQELQELQVPGAWGYNNMRDLESKQQQPLSNSRLGRPTLSTGQNNGMVSTNNNNVAQQNVDLYSSPTMSDLTSQSGLAPLPYQTGPPGTAFRESPSDQDQLLGAGAAGGVGDPQSPLPYGVSVSSSSSVVGPKCSSSSMPRLSNNGNGNSNCIVNGDGNGNSNSNGKPGYQTDYGRRGMIGNGPYSASSSGPSSTGPDHLLNQGMMAGAGGGVGGGPLPDESCFIQRAPALPKPIRTYTKVHKMGAIGRALDVTRFSNYTELRCELARMFNLEGQLDQKSGWQLVFLDNENDILLVGDDPWEEFVTSVRGIRILSPSEVYYYMNQDRLTGTGGGGAYNS